MLYSTNYESPVGKILLVGDGRNLTGLWLDGQKHFAATVGADIVRKDDLQIFDSARHWLDRYFRGGRPQISELSLAPQGTEFRRAVWEILRRIPYGKVITYGEITVRLAAQMGKQAISPRAVGGAVGHNPISIIIPCHRVVGANGSLTGYAGGLDNKIKLLELEGVDTSKIYQPAKKNRDH
jgi:methylated-DNA-[protein]-cysteine S-methyltransferase